MTSDALQHTVAPLVYIASTVLFILGIKDLAKVRTARRGNAVAALGMLLAIVGALLELGLIDYRWIIGGVIVGTIIGAVFAIRVEMTAMPEMVALFNGFGGLASALVGVSVFWLDIEQAHPTTSVADTMGGAQAITVALSIIVGSVTFTGSLVALLKLQGRLKKGQPILLPSRHVINVALAVAAVVLSVWLYRAGADTAWIPCILLAVVSLVLGVLLTIPIGGADMPVVVSLLNSYSGIAASMAGFVIGNVLLIVAGAMVGAAGLILTQIMCVAMNRSLLNVLIGGFGATEASGESGGSSEYKNVKSCGPEEAAMVLETAESVIIVPGYGLAVAQAQHATREFATELEKRGTKVRYAIHPVAGRMPGHMNVLLAEADVPYEQLVEMDLINGDFADTDVSIILGANDVVNPVANKDPSSPIYGMPILNAYESQSVFVVKRSLSPGYAGIKNELFEYPNTMMIFGDAKDVLQSLIAEVKAL
ncbi:MAG: NAD(P)(+) transhydrogenase (Re/Si-specific) subunit beta [Myxococcales bacterium]|nr:NAD(P)(+) transhydrogenase (Re/Si-specific) subunit beta [Myxococcales bacterium]